MFKINVQKTDNGEAKFKSALECHLRVLLNFVSPIIILARFFCTWAPTLMRSEPKTWNELVGVCIDAIKKSGESLPDSERPVEVPKKYICFCKMNFVFMKNLLREGRISLVRKGKRKSKKINVEQNLPVLIYLEHSLFHWINQFFETMCGHIYRRRETLNRNSLTEFLEIFTWFWKVHIETKLYRYECFSSSIVSLMTSYFCKYFIYPNLSY